jgi:hypothetical protein
MNQTSIESGAAWQDVYAAALLELDRQKLSARIKEAEQAISARYASDPAPDADEVQRMADAMNNLSVLRREAKLSLGDVNAQAKRLAHEPPASPPS